MRTTEKQQIAVSKIASGEQNNYTAAEKEVEMESVVSRENIPSTAML